MPQVYKRDNRKYIIIGIMVFLVLDIILAYFLLLRKDRKETILTQFYQLVEEQDYQGMYDLLSDKAKEEHSIDDFTRRNKNIYEGIEATDFVIEVSERNKSELTYTLTFESVAGTVEFENTTAFTSNKIDWDDSFIFPDLSADDKVRVTTLDATRGKIVDRNDVALALQGEAYQVGLVPGELNGEDDYETIGKLLSLSTESIQNTMSASWIEEGSFVPLKTVAGDDEAIEELTAIDGVQLSDTTIRTYPYAKQTAHLIGYIQKVTSDDLQEHEGEGYDINSYIGRTGIEAAYESTLKGQDGAKITIIDSHGKEKAEIAQRPKKDGEDVKLTIDIELQESLYDAFEKDKSASVAIDPASGEVLALVSTPSYDINAYVLGMSDEEWDDLNNDQDRPLTNRFKQTYAPGSTMKSLTAAIGLNTGLLDASKDYKAQKQWQNSNSWGSYYVSTLHAPSPNTLENALIYSDNVYFAKAAVDIGAQHLVSGYEAMKIGEDIPFEISLNKSQYTNDTFEDEIQIADSGYGQGEILMNPVQVASIYGAFVNDGNMMTPHVVKSTNVSLWSEAFSKDVADEMLGYLTEVIADTNGTAHSFYHSDIILAGKTGTAEVKASKDDESGSEIGWFTVMTTDSDQPLVITSVVEDVKNRGGSAYVVNTLKTPFDQYIKK